MAYDRKKAAEQLKKQTEQNYQRKDSGGYSSILKGDLPNWKCGAGKHKIDIVPFEVGKHHPTLEKGSYAYMLEIWTHYGIGQNGDTFLCLNKVYGEDCPVCEYRKKLIDEGETDKETLNSLRPKQYTLYNVVVYDTPAEEAKGVQIFNVAHFFMEKNLLSVASAETGEPIPYSDPDLGRVVSFERQGTGAGNTSYIGHTLLERTKIVGGVKKKYVISDAVLAKAFKLDECITKPTYDEVHDALYGRKHKDAEEDAVSAVDEDVHTDDSIAETTASDDAIKDMSRKEMKQYIEDNSLAIDPNDYDEKSDLAEAIIALSACTEDTGAASLEASSCPHPRGVFGVKFDEYDECPSCGNFDECSSKYDELKAAKVPAGIVKRNKK
jgi:hypothetical protein